MNFQSQKSQNENPPTVNKSFYLVKGIFEGSFVASLASDIIFWPLVVSKIKKNNLTLWILCLNFAELRL